MGGQACVFYGAAEFSRDLDLLILGDQSNLALLSGALRDLQAEPIAVPPFEAVFLQRGHAVHFRCRRDDVAGLRIDVMASLRGVDSFGGLWTRRTTIEVAGEPVDLLAIEDLVRAKKTQRDKDWPMIARLVERSFLEKPAKVDEHLAGFWLQELRSPQLLTDAARAYPALAAREGLKRAAVQAAMTGTITDVEAALHQEEQEERRRDREYWAPLKQELEQLRLARARRDPDA